LLTRSQVIGRCIFLFLNSGLQCRIRGRSHSLRPSAFLPSPVHSAEEAVFQISRSLVAKSSSLRDRAAPPFTKHKSARRLMPNSPSSASRLCSVSGRQWSSPCEKGTAAGPVRHCRSPRHGLPEVHEVHSFRRQSTSSTRGVGDDSRSLAVLRSHIRASGSGGFNHQRHSFHRNVGLRRPWRSPRQEVPVTRRDRTKTQNHIYLLLSLDPSAGGTHHDGRQRPQRLTSHFSARRPTAVPSASNPAYG